MRAPCIEFVLLLLVTLIVSCGEEDNTQDYHSVTDGNGKAVYSGITEVDAHLTFKTVDTDDWRDDGILVDCIAYPNPVILSLENYYLRVRYKIMSQAHVAMIMRYADSSIYRPCPNSETRPYTVWNTLRPFPDGQEPGIHSANLALACQYGTFTLPEPGIYRLFIYASESDLVIKMLEDTGSTNAPRGKYSIVYGDVSIMHGTIPKTKVTSLTISEGMEIPANAPITAIFSRQMTHVDIKVTGTTGTTILSGDGKSATWTPSQDMAQGAHTLTITGRDTFDQELEILTITFKAIAPDRIPPAIVDAKCDPKNGATGIDPDAYREIVIAFNEAVVSAKVTATDPEFRFSSRFKADHTALVISLMSYRFPNETTCTVGIRAADLAGNEAELKYSFTTKVRNPN